MIRLDKFDPYCLARAGVDHTPKASLHHGLSRFIARGGQEHTTQWLLGRMPGPRDVDRAGQLLARGRRV